MSYCQNHDLVLVHDFPYMDFVFPQGEQTIAELAPSILQADPNKTVSIEFFTFSKSYNMGGFRVGFAIGNAELILALRQIKAVVDFNQYQGILNGAIAALTGPQDHIAQNMEVFAGRRDTFIDRMQTIGWNIPKPEATLYIWAKLPEPWSEDSMGFCQQLVEKTGVAASPGVGFGQSGEGYVRFALVHPPDVLETAVERIGEFMQTSQPDLNP